MKKEEIKGIWWLPEDENLKLPGTLTYDWREITLEVMEVWGRFYERKVLDVSPVPISMILGFSTGGKKVTLYDCGGFPKISIPGISSTTFRTQFAIIGKHFNAPEEICFNTIFIGLSGLDYWLGYNPFYWDFESSVNVNKFSPIELFSNDMMRIILMPNINYERSHYGRFILNYFPVLKVEFGFCKPIEDIRRYVYYLQNLFSLLVSEPVSVFKLYSIEIDEDPIYHQKIKNPIEIFFRLPSFNPSGFEREHWSTVLCPYGTIEPSMSDIFGEWFRQVDMLGPIYNLFLATIYFDNLFLELKFLSFVVVLEALHRAFFNGLELPEEEHLKRINEILNSVPQEYRNWLNDKLKFSNEVSLRKRLKEFIEDLSDIEFVKNIISKREFVHKVVNIRNDLVHYAFSRKAPGMKELDVITQKIEVLLRTFILKKLGVPSSVLNKQLPKKYSGLMML